MHLVCTLLKKIAPKGGEICPISGQSKKHKILSRLCLSWVFRPRLYLESLGDCSYSFQGSSTLLSWQLQLPASFSKNTFPRGPKDWKNSRFPFWIEVFKRPISDWKFQSRLKISSASENKASFCGEILRSGLKFSIEIEFFNRDWKFQAWIEIFKRMDWKFHAINRDWIVSIVGPSGFSMARKPWSANRELRGWQRRGCRDRCQEGPEKGAWARRKQQKTSDSQARKRHVNF